MDEVHGGFDIKAKNAIVFKGKSNENISVAHPLARSAIFGKFIYTIPQIGSSIYTMSTPCNPHPHDLDIVKSHLNYSHYIRIDLCTGRNGSDQIHSHLAISGFLNKWSPTCKTPVRSRCLPKTLNGPTIHRNMLIPPTSKI